MKYLLLVGSEGLAEPQEMTVMNREIPGWAEEMERRGVLLLGRPLELPQTAATVLVRDGETRERRPVRGGQGVDRGL
jgi:hypothetical protein